MNANSNTTHTAKNTALIILLKKGELSRPYIVLLAIIIALHPLTATVKPTTNVTTESIEIELVKTGCNKSTTPLGNVLARKLLITSIGR